MTPNLPRGCAALAIAVALVYMTGCGKPSEETRQNRRLVDGLLTAVTTKNARELEKCRGLLAKRHGDRLLSERNHTSLAGFIDLARAGKWAEAEEALYKFREAEPFPR